MSAKHWDVLHLDAEEGPQFDSWGVVDPSGNDGQGEEIASVWDEASARLIAAAPDLLEALHQVAATLTHDKNNLGRVVQVIRVAQTAIAKAEGK